jgi:hypothetical protein
LADNVWTNFLKLSHRKRERPVHHRLLSENIRPTFGRQAILNWIKNTTATATTGTAIIWTKQLGAISIRSCLKTWMAKGQNSRKFWDKIFGCSGEFKSIEIAMQLPLFRFFVEEKVKLP